MAIIKVFHPNGFASHLQLPCKEYIFPLSLIKNPIIWKQSFSEMKGKTIFLPQRDHNVIYDRISPYIHSYCIIHMYNPWTKKCNSVCNILLRAFTLDSFHWFRNNSLSLSLSHHTLTHICIQTHRHANNHMAIAPYVSCSTQPLPCSTGPKLDDHSLFFPFFYLNVDGTQTTAAQGLLSADLAYCCYVYLICTELT